MQTKLINTDQSSRTENSMTKAKHSTIGFVLAAALLGTLTGCIGYVDGPRQGRGYAPPPVYVDTGVAVQDDYVYYPGYEVYYSGHSRQYIYRDGSAWVSRPAPPRVSVDVLFASPSVRLDFHDAPAIHHERVVRTYPRNWAPPGWSHGNKGGRDENYNRNNRGRE
jgi:hypothetical protein